MCQRSRLGSPSTIHSATTLPIPPAPASPWAQKPAPTKKPATSRLAEAELVVGREGLGAVDQFGHRDVVHRRHPPLELLGDLLEAVPLLFQQAAVEVGRDRLEADRCRRAGRPVRSGARSRPSPGRRRPRGSRRGGPGRAGSAMPPVRQSLGRYPSKTAATREPARSRASRTASSGCVTRYWWDIGSERDADAGHAADLGGEHAAGVDHHLGLDVAAVGAHAAHPARRAPRSRSPGSSVKIRQPPRRAPSASA